MANIAATRIKREFKEVMKSEEVLGGQINLQILDNTWTHLQGEILGPQDTPYAGGRFELDIQVPDTYPFQPPKIRFVNYIWHPNVSSVTGHICLDILKDQWAAALTLRTVLLSIQALLSSAEPNDPQDAMVATQYKENMEMFLQTAQHWTNVYANGPHFNFDCIDKVARLVDLGFESHKALISLSYFNWDVEAATENLLG